MIGLSLRVDNILPRRDRFPFPRPLLVTLLPWVALALFSHSLAATPPDPADYNLSAIADPPRWHLLDPYQFTITRDDFADALRAIYSEGDAYKTTIKILDDHAAITRSTKQKDWPPYRLNFAPSPSEKPPPKTEKPFWRAAQRLPDLHSNQRPLADLTIAIDPGHIGGKWARIESRWFQIDNKPPVKEGELTLIVARLLKPKLEALGARVILVRNSLEPVTESRPADFHAAAVETLRRNGIADPKLSYEDLESHSPAKHFTVQWLSELYFYRAREIRDRAKIINTEIRPDIVLCLHFNAEAWGNPENPTFVENNHLHVICNGTYSLGEFSQDDIRFEMLRRLLQQIHEEEVPLCDTVAHSMVDATGLAPYVYPGTNAKRINGNAHLFARNLLANRVYLCPVVFLEPYVMNHKDVFSRLENAESQSPNIFEEYAEGVTAGLAKYYRLKRGAPSPQSPN